jgi:hypothetical protein
MDVLRDGYIAGVATAEAHFADSSADEDFVTGAWGQALAMSEPLNFSDRSDDFSVQISHRKVRGHGLNAPEQLYGSNGIFQIAATTEEALSSELSACRFTKCADIEVSTGEGIVVDYTTTGYRAYPTDLAVKARGNRREVERRNGTKPPGQLLDVDFLNVQLE